MLLELVCHCRIVRGLLLVVGRPDGRLGSQVKNESWVLLGLLQVCSLWPWVNQDINMQIWLTQRPQVSLSHLGSRNLGVFCPLDLDVYALL